MFPVRLGLLESFIFILGIFKIGKYRGYKMLVRFFQENLSIKLDYTFCPFGINAEYTIC